MDETPSLCRWFIAAAGWLVPADTRAIWRLERNDELRKYWTFLQERGEVPERARSRLIAFCRAVIIGAARQRFEDGDPRPELRRGARGPLFCLVAVCLFLILAAAMTGVFSGIRTIYAPLPFPDADRLVSCYQVHFLSVSFGAQSRYVRPWQDGSETLEGLEADQVHHYSEGVEGARVTPGFFRLLGVRPVLGRFFKDDETERDSLVVLSYAIWQKRFHGDPAVVGRFMRLDGRNAGIIGVLPENFWFRSRDLQVWTLLPDLTRLDPATRLVGTVGRLRPGITPAAALSELQTLAFRSSRFRGGAFRVVPLSDSLRPSLQFILFSWTVGVLLAIGIALIQWARSWMSESQTPGDARKYWFFFGAKSVMLLTVMAVIGVEFAARNALALRVPYRFVVSLFIDWASILATLFTLRWAILDQSRRCPVCLRRLGTTITSGSWSSSLLEPASTEMLCDQGHGSLCFTGSYSTLGEIRRWITLDESWRELIAADQR